MYSKIVKENKSQLVETEKVDFYRQFGYELETPTLVEVKEVTKLKAPKTADAE